MRKKTLLVIVISLLSLTLIFHTAAAALPRTVANVYPEENATYVPVDSKFIVELDRYALNGREISPGNLNDSGIYLLDQNRKRVPLKQIAVENNMTLVIEPQEILEFGKKYELIVRNTAVRDASNTRLLTRDLNIPFSTDFYNFYNLMVQSEISPLLMKYAPRQVQVVAPRRYIQEIEILHKRRGTVSDYDIAASEAVTNVDVITDDDIERVRVVISKDGKTHTQKNARLFEENSANGKKHFDVGFTKLPTNFDVTVYTYDDKNQLVDEKIIKLTSEDATNNSQGEAITEVKETYTYQTAGKGYSMYELLKNQDLFSKLLEENDMRKLKVQLIER